MQLVSSPDDEPWGYIPAVPSSWFRPKPIAAGEIVVPFGDKGKGYIHTLKHLSKIKQFHPSETLEGYISIVLRKSQRMYLAKDNSIWLVHDNGMRKFAMVAPHHTGETLVYRLITAYPLPRDYDYIKRGAERIF